MSLGDRISLDRGAGGLAVRRETADPVGTSNATSVEASGAGQGVAEMNLRRARVAAKMTSVVGWTGRRSSPSTSGFSSAATLAVTTATP